MRSGLFKELLRCPRRLRVLKLPGDVIFYAIPDEIGARLMEGKGDAGGITLPVEVLYPVEIKRPGIFP